MLVQIPIILGRPDDYIAAGFTHLELWLSSDEGRNSKEITASSASAASLRANSLYNAYRAGGKTLSVDVDATIHNFNFDSALDYWTPSQMASKINESVSGLASVPVHPKPIVLTSPTTGHASHLEITSPALGIPGLVWTELESYGRMARLEIDPDIYTYVFTDPVGTSSNIYCWRASANGGLPQTDFSAWMSGTTSPILNSSDLSLATARFASLDGLPVKRKIIVGTSGVIGMVGGVYVWNTVPSIYEADETGFVAIPMARNTKVLVAVEGTYLVKEFVVPNQETFDLLQVMGDAPDLFTIQQPPPLLTRRSL